MEDIFKINTKLIIEGAVKDGKADSSILGLWSSLNLNELEEFVLTNLYPVNVNNLEDSLIKYKEKLSIIRSYDSNCWVSTKETDALNIEKQTLTSQEFINAFTSSLYLWMFGYYPIPVIEVLNKIAKALDDEDFVFLEFGDELSSFYIRATLMLRVRYFSEIKTTWQCHILSSQNLLLAMEIGLDIDSALKSSIKKLMLLENRREYSRIYASFIRNNPSYIGFSKEDNTPVKIDYWLNLFKNYSHGEFDGLSLANFFKDEDVWQNCDLIDKAEVRQIFTLYFNLISDYYVMPNVADSIALERKVSNKKVVVQNNYQDIKKDIEQKFKTNASGEFIDLDKVFLELKNKAEEYNDPKILEIYYWDEKEGKFKWSI